MVLTEDERRQVAEAVARAELHTRGEIFCIVAPDCGDYRETPLAAAAFAALAAPALLLAGGVQVTVPGLIQGGWTAAAVGAAAGGPEMAFPARLEVALRERYPGIEMKVINAGRPRDLTRAMVDRGVRVLDRGAWFLSGSHDDAVIDQTLQVVEDSVKAALR